MADGPAFTAGKRLPAADLQQLGTKIASRTPTLSATTTDPVLGTGGSAGMTWSRHGDLIIGRFAITFGTSGTSAGVGTYLVDLPEPADLGGLSSLVLGSGWINDSSAIDPRLVVLDLAISEDPTLQSMRMIPEGGVVVTEVSPFAWSANDGIYGEFTYPA